MKKEWKQKQNNEEEEFNRREEASKKFKYLQASVHCGERLLDSLYFSTFALSWKLDLTQSYRRRRSNTNPNDNNLEEGKTRERKRSLRHFPNPPVINLSFPSILGFPDSILRQTDLNKRREVDRYDLSAIFLWSNSLENSQQGFVILVSWLCERGFNGLIVMNQSKWIMLLPTMWIIQSESLRFIREPWVWEC